MMLLITPSRSNAQLDDLYQKQQNDKANITKLCLIANSKAQYWHTWLGRNAITVAPTNSFVQTLKNPYGYSNTCAIKKQGILGKTQLENGEEVLYKLEENGIVQYSKDNAGNITRVLYGRPKYKYSKEHLHCQKIREKAQYKHPTKNNIFYTYESSGWGLTGSEINPKDSSCKINFIITTWQGGFPANWKDIESITRVEEEGIFEYTKDISTGEISKTLIGIPNN